MKEIWQPKRYSRPNFCANFVLSITDDDPITVREVVKSKDSELWKKTMVEEMECLDTNEALDLVEFPTRRNPTSRKWVFKNKLNVEGVITYSCQGQ